jgi:hypothetical protein
VCLSITAGASLDAGGDMFVAAVLLVDPWHGRLETLPPAMEDLSPLLLGHGSGTHSLAQKTPIIQ